MLTSGNSVHSLISRAAAMRFPLNRSSLLRLNEVSVPGFGYQQIKAVSTKSFPKGKSANFPNIPLFGGVSILTLTCGVGILVGSGLGLYHTDQTIQLEPLSPSEPVVSDMGKRMSLFIKGLQKNIVKEICAMDGKEFKEDSWRRALGGEGISCVLENGNVFERAGVNISIVHGKLPMAAVKQMRAEASAQLTGSGPFDFFTASISLVIHPHNPMAPTVHLNYRYFEVQNPKAPESPVWWFGGGSDLTPAYLFDEDAKHFHTTLKKACDPHNKGFYPKFKVWCDKYFMNTHRSESRGIGGIFFDDLDHESGDREALFKFVQDCGNSFLPSYLPLVQRRKDFTFTPAQKEWQQLRRGRYVEFNLIHDRGTKFGLHTPNPRIESILVSLPLTARWMYDIKPSPGSPEEYLVNVLKNPKDWA